MMERLLRLDPGQFPSVLPNPLLLIREGYLSIALPGNFSVDALDYYAFKS